MEWSAGVQWLGLTPTVWPSEAHLFVIKTKELVMPYRGSKNGRRERLKKRLEKLKNVKPEICNLVYQLDGKILCLACCDRSLVLLLINCKDFSKPKNLP